jgi:anti-sigma-K factor RskA
MHRRRRQVRLIAIGAVGAVGAVLFYFLDPEQGPARREAARAWMSVTVRRALDRALGAPIGAETEPFPDLTPKIDEPEAEPARTEPLVVSAVETATGAPHISWPEELPADTAVTFVHGEAGRSPQIIAYDAEPPVEAEDEAEPEAEAEVKRERVHEAAAQEPVSARRSLAFPLTVSLAGVAALAAVALGLWALSLSDSRSSERDAARATSASQAQAIALLSQPGAKRIPVKGSQGSIVLVVGSAGKAALIVSDLDRAPAGKTYQTWVVTGQKPKPAGVFFGGPRTIVSLKQKVPTGAIVAVTLEPRGGLAAPTGTILFSAKRGA